MNPYYTCNVAVENEAFALVNVLSNKKSSEFVEWNIVPNMIQSNGEVNLEINAVNSLNINISIFSSNGQRVGNVDQKKLEPGQNILPVNIADLSAGVYMISISGKDGFSSKKLIVQ